MDIQTDRVTSIMVNDSHAASKADTDIELVWWLVELAQKDRALYRELRLIAWELVQANPQSSENPNERS